MGGTFLRWGQTVCLTPDDMLVTVERMERCTDGEGGPTGGCILRQLVVEYVDENESIWPVAAYSNTLYYDGTLLSQTPYAGLASDQSATRCAAPLVVHTKLQKEGARLHSPLSYSPFERVLLCMAEGQLGAWMVVRLRVASRALGIRSAS